MEPNKYLYNGKEFQNELGLDLYQTLFRLYEPAIGRFVQIDPLADFFPGINPYSFGLNNPILFGDPDGLAPFDWLKRLFRGSHGDGASKQARASQKNNNAPGAIRPARGKGASNTSKSSSNPSPTDTGGSEGTKMAGIPTIPRPKFDYSDESKRSNFDKFDDPREFAKIPSFDDHFIYQAESVTFNKEIIFKRNSDKFYDIPHNNKIIYDLIKTLKEFPQLLVEIEGNAGADHPSQSLYYGRSEKALNQPAELNGNWTKTGVLMKSRAKAIYDALINNGINPQRVKFDAGTYYDNPKGRTTSIKIINP